MKKIFLKALDRIRKDIFKKRIRTAFLIILLVFLFWKTTLGTTILGVIFFSFLLYGWENRIIAGLALLFLASCPFLLIYKKEAVAEQMAIYAYYFLVMTVVLQIKEYWGESKNLNKLNSKDDL